VVQGDGEAVDGFADIVVLNYEVLDRHMGWLGDFDFRGMVVDEAHFIKNKTSQRVLALSDRIRSRAARPLLMALTGTPLINDIDVPAGVGRSLHGSSRAAAVRWRGPAGGGGCSGRPYVAAASRRLRQEHLPAVRQVDPARRVYRYRL
jgi:hypothetical protein